MEFCLLQDGTSQKYGGRRSSVQERYHEMVAEAALAEEWGFDSWGLAEQHFLPDGACIPAPDMLLAAGAMCTTTLKLRVASAVLLTHNHPVRVAERLAALDLLSNGRAQLSTARSNNIKDLEAFEIDPQQTRAQWSEAVDVIAAALTQDPFEHHGEFWNIPPRSLSPKPVQRPHPPIYVAATSVETVGVAARKGIGCLSGNSLPGGWDYVEKCIDLYKSTLAEAEPVTGHVVDWIGISCITAHCAESDAVAREEAQEAAFAFVDIVLRLFDTIGATAPDYKYMLEARDKINEHKRDLDWLIDRAPFISIGTPDFLIERIKRLEALGADEILLRVDGMGHDVHKRSIEMFGKHVIPEFKRAEKVAGAEVAAH